MGGQKKSEGSLFQRLPLIGCAAAISETSTYPIDLVKTRMQYAEVRIGWIGTTVQAW